MTNRIGSTGTASLTVASPADGAARATRLGLAHLAPQRVYRPIHRGGEVGGGLLAAEATGAGHHRQGGGAPVLLLREDGPGFDHRREQRLQLGQLAGDLVLVGARDGHPAGADDHLHGTPASAFLGLQAPLVRRQDPQLLAIFGDGAPGDGEPLPLQRLGDLLIGERLAAVLAGDHVADRLLDRHRRDHRAVLGGDAAVEEELQLEEALRRLHVLIGGDPADGGLVHADVVAHVAQGEGAEERQALVEELALEVHQALRDLPERPLTLLHALDQPHSGAELLLDVLLGLVARPPQERAVERVHPQARDALLVEDHHVVLAHLLDRHVGYHVARVVDGDAPARLGLEGLDLFDRFHDPLDRQLHGPRDLGVAAPLQVFEVLLHDLYRHRVRLRVGGELQEQALLHATRGDPGRIEGLDTLERGLYRLEARAHPLRDLLQVGPQVAVLVQVADDRLADAQEILVVGAEPELLAEMLGERGVAAPQVLEGQLVALLHRDRGPLVAVVVENGGREIERQVVGLLPVHRGRLLGDRLGHLPRGRSLHRGGSVGSGWGGRGLRSVGGLDRDLLEERILLQLLAHDLLQLQRGQLHQLDRLLQQRGHDDPLTHLPYEFHGVLRTPIRARTSRRGRARAPWCCWRARWRCRTPGCGRRRECRRDR